MCAFKKGLVSVIIPCYNHGKYIVDAIESVEKYHGDFEIIIVNDGSTDCETNLVLSELKNKGYNVIFQENQGLGKTRNNAIKLSLGEFILPLDADNLISPKYLDLGIQTLCNNQSIDIVYSDKELIGNMQGVRETGEFNISDMLVENYIDACAIFRRRVWETVGGYDEEMPLQGVEDWDLWLSAYEKGFNFYYIRQPLYYYRVADDSMLKKLNTNARFNELLGYVYRKHIFILADEYKKIKHYKAPSLKVKIRSKFKFLKKFFDGFQFTY